MSLSATKNIVAVAVSGGVDSLYALASLAEKGYSVVALHGIFLDIPQEQSPIQGLQKNCERLGIPLWTEDLRAEFEARVIHPFARAYADGETPNPCAMCNARIKFGLLFERAIARGATHFATGHYTNLAEHSLYGRVIFRAADYHKDQSYFLALVPRERLCATFFPLADIFKDEARRKVASLGLEVPTPKESQDICFVQNSEDGYRSLLCRSHIELGEAGDIVLNGTERVLGRHNGLWRYTEGQRHGLGIAWSEPLFVLRKDKASNRLIVCVKQSLLETECLACDANFLVPYELWRKPLFVRTRYRQKAVSASVDIFSDGRDGTRLHIRFDEPQRKSASGQIAAVYDSDGILLAGGVLAYGEG